MELILASTSPRRRQLLSEGGFVHSAMAPGVDDATLKWDPVTPPHQWTAALALLKGRAAVEQVGARAAHAVVLAADTIVVKDGLVLGQPMTEDEATRTLKTLESGTHMVMTGVSIVGGGRTVLFTDEASVRVGVIGDERIAAYVASGGWRGKAGAYNLFERLADGWPISYSGDPTTIMGLPMERLGPILRRMLDPTSEAAP
ncbi:MAG: Maf family protein [Phycisphaerae bacterium]|nr:Maf family protein [Phycisphaerae bacterium]